MATTGKGHGSQDRKREIALGALLTTGSLAKAAKQAGISKATIGRWMKDPDFAAAHAAQRTRVLESATLELQDALLTAVRTLVRNMNPKAPPSQQVRSAVAVIEQVRGHKLNVGGPNGGPIPIGAIVLRPEILEKFNDEQRAAFRALVAFLAGADAAPGDAGRDRSA